MASIDLVQFFAVFMHNWLLYDIDAILQISIGDMRYERRTLFCFL